MSKRRRFIGTSFGKLRDVDIPDSLGAGTLLNERITLGRQLG
jgi:hypothetical protein